MYAVLISFLETRSIFYSDNTLFERDALEKNLNNTPIRDRMSGGNYVKLILFKYLTRWQYEKIRCYKLWSYKVKFNGE